MLLKTKLYPPDPPDFAIRRERLIEKLSAATESGSHVMISAGAGFGKSTLIFPDGPPSYIETFTAEGQNHSFRVAPLCYRGAWDVLKYSESTRNKITGWLMSQLE